MIKCRIDLAKALLLQGQSSIADVALQVGFTSQSHFSKHFKHLSGNDTQSVSGELNRLLRLTYDTK
ncbi:MULTISPECIES: helix-turn-helix domain-containing protein [Fischerella]|uniref:helix-turn-helix domain-containing protein n=1 Tax=Fischerella TaxID=1190 RepID=UPI0008FBF4F6|nr:helix-turn-helix domain-containing protein [Fischerella muscicola]